MPDLKHYRDKRDPARTPEPFPESWSPEPRPTDPDASEGARTLPPEAPRAFVIQQHAATRMHWDLRLEIGGVLVSWAVPRGPSLDPQEKRLAVQTEDHPLEYADFEGIIPQGNYGAGAMILWDRGRYQNVDGRSPAEGLAAGKLDLLVEGHKLVGRFALVRTGGEPKGRSWLLLRKGDPPADDAEIVERLPGSVLSGLTVDELREGVSRDAVVSGLLAAHDAPEGSLPRRPQPMLASIGDEPFSDPDWWFEVKHDGMRALIERRADGSVRLISRRGRDVTRNWPELERAAGHLPVSDLLIDGEIVTLDRAGRSSFERLQPRFSLSDPRDIARAEVEIPVLFQAFDALFAAGRDLRRLPLRIRKQALACCVPRHGAIRFADHVEEHGEALFEMARQHDFEGIIAKLASSSYDEGRRSRHWLKLKVPRAAPLLIVGWQRGKGSRSALGSLMLAWHAGERLVYAGNVGSGLDAATIDALLPELEARRQPAPPCVGAPRASDAREWCSPELVCQVRYTEVTSAGLLRHPVFDGLREEVAPEDCVAPADRDLEPEPPAEPEPEVGLELRNLDKVFWPAEGYTKGDLLAYYEAVWPWLAPYLRDRPLVLTRYPDGIDGKFFYQKNAPDFTPDWVGRERIEDTDYFLCNDLETLLYVINSGAIPLHVWSARRQTLDRPDWLILDLDPKEAPFAHVVEIARLAHRLLDELDAPHFVKTSGQDGLHVMLPLGARLDHEQAKRLGEVLARTLVAQRPDIATVARPVAARADRVYIDYLQNGRGKLIAAPFSVRPRAGAPVSTPLTWGQVTARLDPVRWNIRTTPKRMRSRGDACAGLLSDELDVAALLEGLGAYLDEAAQ